MSKIYKSNKGKITIYNKDRYFDLLSKDLNEKEKEILREEFKSIEEGVEYEKDKIGIIKSI